MKLGPPRLEKVSIIDTGIYIGGCFYLQFNRKASLTELRDFVNNACHDLLGDFDCSTIQNLTLPPTPHADYATSAVDSASLEHIETAFGGDEDASDFDCIGCVWSKEDTPYFALFHEERVTNEVGFMFDQSKVKHDEKALEELLGIFKSIHAKLRALVADSE